MLSKKIIKEKFFKEFWTSFRYVIIGGIAALSHITLAILFFSVFHIPPIYANILAFCIAFSMSLFGHYFWVFNSSKPFFDTAIQLLLLNFFSLSVNTVALDFILDLQFFKNEEVAITLASMLIPIINYLVSRFYIFKPQTL